MSADGDNKSSGDTGEELSLQQKSSKKQLESGYYSVVSRAGADGKFFIGTDIEVFPNKERPEFAGPGVRGYEAKDRRQESDLVALLCDRETLPRVTHIGSYKSLRNTNLMTLVEAGIVDWPAENRQKFSFVFERPRGRRLLETPDGVPMKLSEDGIIPYMVEPIVRLLAGFRNVELVHGAINLGNIFMAGNEGQESTILGECLSTALGLRQNPIYETQARAMAQPSGRGPGSVSDDLYALGVCVAMVARGENLMKGKTWAQIIHDKIDQGSYATIIGKERIPGGLSEFLRGVLSDDENQRWGLDEVLTWLEGRRLSPKQARVTLKAARPMSFHGQKYWDLRSLGQAFSENVLEAAMEVEKGQFDTWLKRNFDDKGLDLRLGRVWDREKQSPKDRMISFVIMAMDPLAPIRFKGLSMFPDGFGTALAHATARGEDTQYYGEILHQQLFNAWVSQSFDDIPDAAGILAMLERCRTALTQKMPGYGLERIIYMLNVEAPCMSPLLKNFFVLSPGGLLLALENISRQPNRPEALLDRHMIAFISVREPKMIDSNFGYVNSASRGQQLVGIIRVMAGIQRRFSVGNVPGLCSWLISLIPPMIDLLNDRDLRQDLSKRVNALQGSGNLTALLDLVDDPIMIRDDAARFSYAQQEYAALVNEKALISAALQNKHLIGRDTGRQVAMLVACAVSFMAIVGFLALRYMKIV